MTGPAEQPAAAASQRPGQQMGGDVLGTALAWLAGHPGSSAATIAEAIGERDHQYVFRVLDAASYQGACQRERHARWAVWLWEIPPRAAAEPEGSDDA